MTDVRVCNVELQDIDGDIELVVAGCQHVDKDTHIIFKKCLDCPQLHKFAGDIVFCQEEQTI